MIVEVIDEQRTRALRRSVLRPQLPPNAPLPGAVLDAAVAQATLRGADLLWCRARIPAVPFYAGHGFATHGTVFADERHPIPHQYMWRELPGSPNTSK